MRKSMYRSRNMSDQQSEGSFFQDERGSATVEAAVIVPIILVILWLVIYMGLYLYDRNVIYFDAYLSAFRAAELAGTGNEEVYSEAAVQMEQAIEGQLIALPEVSQEITVTRKGVQIAYSGEVVVPVVQNGLLFGEWASYAFAGEARAERHRPVTFIRRCRALEKLAEQKAE